jgi:protein TonB
LAPAPILVKPGSTSFRETKPQVQDDATVAPPPSAAIASSGVESLGGVLSSTAVKPSLARVNVSQGVSQGLLIKRVEPRYPVNALATHTQGTVQIDATIDKEGRVLNPKVLSGSVLLASAALDAVRQWRYKPYLLDGQPVEIHTQITINFKMR